MIEHGKTEGQMTETISKHNSRSNSPSKSGYPNPLEVSEEAF